MNNQGELFALLKAGLWGDESPCISCCSIDWSVLFKISTGQSVVGLVAAGMDKLPVAERPPQNELLEFVGAAIQLEQRNKAMNKYIAELISEMRKADIYTLLVKGQGIAQCYEKPLWRASWDIDLLLSEENYRRAKDFLLPLFSANKHEERYSQHLGLSIGQWYLEIHGTMRSGLSERVDREIDAVQNSLFYGGNVRSWNNEGTQVFLPAANEDVFLVFTHFIKHFYKEGMSLRQVCDWCRLLYTYRGIH